LAGSLLITTHVFPPDQVSSGYLYADIARAFRDAGWTVTVVTSVPHYNLPEGFVHTSRRRMLGLYREELFEGIRLYRIPQAKKPHIWNRVYQFMRFHATTLIIALNRDRADVVLASSPPLTMGLMGNMLAWLKGARSVYNVQEIYPDIAVAEGSIRNPVLVWLFSLMETLVYRYSDRVVTIDETFSEVLAPRMPDDGRLVSIPNFIDTQLYYPEQKDNAFSRQHGLEDSFVVGYVGNIGMFQNWNIVLEAAARTLGVPGVRWCVVGDGIRREWLISEVARRGLTNMLVLPYQARETVRLVNAAIDVHMVLMTASSDRNGLPSKIFAVMACGRPVVVSCSDGAPLARVMEDAGCGDRVDLDDSAGLAEAVLQLRADTDRYVQYAEAGLDKVRRCYSREAVTQQYVALATELLGKKK
jgi:colanic acid biosynthesis glycosyl transferase WcaI